MILLTVLKIVLGPELGQEPNRLVTVIIIINSKIEEEVNCNIRDFIMSWLYEYHVGINSTLVYPMRHKKLSIVL